MENVWGQEVWYRVKSKMVRTLSFTCPLRGVVQSQFSVNVSRFVWAKKLKLLLDKIFAFNASNMLVVGEKLLAGGKLLFFLDSSFLSFLLCFNKFIIQMFILNKNTLYSKNAELTHHCILKIVTYQRNLNLFRVF